MAAVDGKTRAHLDAQDNAIRANAVEIAKVCEEYHAEALAGDFLDRQMAAADVKRELIRRSWQRVLAEVQGA